ncbi:HTH_Tnp_Tc3_2 domain-containing protein [Trichonephila clavipes]|nr:HTH_Tnp_Tc3_2 domain-containing protein [Trichonephila clavipes]
MSFKRRQGSGRSRQTSRRENRNIGRNARGQPTASSTAFQAKVAPSLGAPVCSRTIQRHLAEGHLGIAETITCAALDSLSSTPPFGVVPHTRKLDCSGMEPGHL